MHKRLEQKTRDADHSISSPGRAGPKALPFAGFGWMKSTLRSRHRGFRAGLTLTEVVVASGLMVVAMVPVLRGLTIAHLHTSIIERKTRSLMVAQARLDEIRARSIYHYSDSLAQSDESLGDSYLCNVTDTSTGPNLREVAVAVGLDLDGDGNLSEDEIEVTLVTQIARRWDS